MIHKRIYTLQYININWILGPQQKEKANQGETHSIVSPILPNPEIYIVC